MQLYDTEEIERISKVNDINEKLEEFFAKKREQWNSNLEPLFTTLKNDFNLENSKKIIDVQSMSLSYRQILNEEISYFLNKRAKDDSKLKKLKQDKFVFYAIGVGLKTNTGEKAILIDGNIAENQRGLELIENYIEFLRNSSKNLESLGYTIKNIIELMNYLGK